jgi:ParB-like nuclease family protein
VNHRESNRAIATPEGVNAAVATTSRASRESRRARTGAHGPARPRNDLVPHLTLVVAPTDRLTPASQSTRRRDQPESERIDSSIKRLGSCPILVNGDVQIVKGHGIWEAAKELGIVQVPCICIVIDHPDASELPLSLALLTALGEDVVLPVFETAEIDPLLRDCTAEARGAEVGVHLWAYQGAYSLEFDAREGLAHRPTVKPKTLLKDAPLDVTDRGDIVLEAFAESGSTLMADDTVGRMRRAIEINALCCDFTIRLWQQMTGLDARLSETLETLGRARATRLDGAPARTASEPDDADSNGEEEDDHEQA